METNHLILLVDDNTDLTMTLSIILKRKGYSVDTAKNGLQAIDLVSKFSYKMVFLDIKMPIMDGVETYRRIKQVRPEMVVTMMTAYAVEDLIQEALQEGAYGVIYKPIDIEKAIALIQEVAEKKYGAFILVVDDDPVTILQLKKTLSKKGFKVNSCTTGEEAITMALTNPYEILFIEMRLPTINGIETYIKMKELNPGVVAIMMTSSKQEISELTQELLTSGFYTCLYKPLDMEKVLHLIREILPK